MGRIDKAFKEAKEMIKKEIEVVEKALLIAKKDFTIVQNEYVQVIKVGDDLINVPERFHENLKTEGVI